MARFRPFRGIRYSSAKSGDMAEVVAPPYDVIDAEARQALYSASPHNVTHLILNREGHSAAGELYRRWIQEQILVREQQPAFYLYCQDFELADGPRQRCGVIGALHLEPFSTGVVRPHEQTFAHHKKDRLDLTQQVKANLSPIFGLYSNAEFCPEPDGGWETPADIDVVHEGVRNRVWVVHDPENQTRISGALDGRTVFIADGHHRYATALNYFALTHPGADPEAEGPGPSDDEEPSAHVLAFLGAFEDPGMIILPTHRELVGWDGADGGRFVAELERDFSIQRVAKSPQARVELLDNLEAAGSAENVFGVVLRDSSDYLVLRRNIVGNGNGSGRGRSVDDLDVKVLHSLVLGRALEAAGGSDSNLAYSADATMVFDHVDSGEAEAGFFMRAMRAQEMADACMAGELLPQKSTYFYPKLLTGLVFHGLE